MAQLCTFFQPIWNKFQGQKKDSDYLCEANTKKHVKRTELALLISVNSRANRWCAVSRALWFLYFKKQPQLKIFIYTHKMMVDFLFRVKKRRWRMLRYLTSPRSSPSLIPTWVFCYDKIYRQFQSIWKSSLSLSLLESKSINSSEPRAAVHELLRGAGEEGDPKVDDGRQKTKSADCWLWRDDTLEHVLFCSYE